jgi:hypothetical protein
MLKRMPLLLLAAISFCGVARGNAPRVTEAKTPSAAYDKAYKKLTKDGWFHQRSVHYNTTLYDSSLHYLPFITDSSLSATEKENLWKFFLRLMLHDVVAVENKQFDIFVATTKSAEDLYEANWLSLSAFLRKHFITPTFFGGMGALAGLFHKVQEGEGDLSVPGMFAGGAIGAGLLIALIALARATRKISVEPMEKIITRIHNLAHYNDYKPHMPNSVRAKLGRAAATLANNPLPSPDEMKTDDGKEKLKARQKIVYDLYMELK